MLPPGEYNNSCWQQAICTPSPTPSEVLSQSDPSWRSKHSHFMWLNPRKPLKQFFHHQEDNAMQVLVVQAQSHLQLLGSSGLVGRLMLVTPGANLPNFHLSDHPKP